MYCKARSIPPPEAQTWSFFMALSLFRAAAILAGVGARAKLGNASSERAALVRPLCPCHALSWVSCGLSSVCAAETSEPLTERCRHLAVRLAEKLPLCYFEPGKPSTGFASQAALLLEVAKHVGEASEDVTNGRISLRRFCLAH